MAAIQILLSSSYKASYYVFAWLNKYMFKKLQAKRNLIIDQYKMQYLPIYKHEDTSNYFASTCKVICKRLPLHFRLYFNDHNVHNCILPAPITNLPQTSRQGRPPAPSLLQRVVRKSRVVVPGRRGVCGPHDVRDGRACRSRAWLWSVCEREPCRVNDAVVAD